MNDSRVYSALLSLTPTSLVHVSIGIVLPVNDASSCTGAHEELDLCSCSEVSRPLLVAALQKKNNSP